MKRWRCRIRVPSIGVNASRYEVDAGGWLLGDVKPADAAAMRQIPTFALDDDGIAEDVETEPEGAEEPEETTTETPSREASSEQQPKTRRRKKP